MLTYTHTHRCPGCGALHDCDDPWCVAPSEAECSDCLAAQRETRKTKREG